MLWREIIRPINYSAARESALCAASETLERASSVDLNLKKLSRSKPGSLLASYFFKHTSCFAFCLLPQGRNCLSLDLHEKTSSVALSRSIRMSQEALRCPWSSATLCQCGCVQMFHEKDVLHSVSNLCLHIYL